MKTFDKPASCHFDPVRYFDFARFNDQAGDFVLIEGLPAYQEIENIKNEKIVYINFEEPNGIFSDTLTCHKFEDVFYKIFTICPYTSEWLNKKFNNDKRTVVYIPFNENYIPPINEKTYDVIYAGSIPSNEIDRVLIDISKFKYCFLTYNPTRMATHIDPTYEEKLSLISKSKITVVHNLLFPRPSHLQNATKIYSDALQSCEAYNQVQNYIIPQLKSRLFEAAFCRSLILCRRDPWNIVERYFTPDVDFIYFDPGQLKDKIEDILKNYDNYSQIIENAYNKAISNYTTKHFFETFLKDLK